MYKIQVQNRPVNGIFKPFQNSDRANIRSKGKAVSHKPIVQRLFPYSVPDQVKCLLFFVIQGNGKHPLAEGNGFPYSIRLKCLQQDFRIGSPPESRHLLFFQEPAGNFLIVIYLPIIGNHKPTAVGNHRLRAVF